MIKPVQPSMPNYESYIDEIRDIWDTKILTNNGPKVQKLQKHIQAYMGCKNADLFVNGHSALVIAMRVLGLEGEVLTSPFTFVSTINAIEQNGLIPVFCDIDDSYNVNVGKLEGYITARTCAIVVPHIFGIPCRVDEIEKIASKHRLKVIYDGAQAFGTKIGDRHIGSFGDITMFSLHAIKIYNAIEGGVLVYSDETLREKFELYRNFGISYEEGSNDVPVCGVNAKMNEFQAAMGILGLDIVEKEIGLRKALAQIYIARLKGIEGIRTYPYEDAISYNYAYFPVRVNRDEFGMSRDELFLALKDRGIMTRKLYDRLCCDYSYYQEKHYMKDVVYARKVSEEALDLPLYGSLQPEEVEHVCRMISMIQSQNRQF